MTEKFQTEGSATRRYALTSAELTEVIAIHGKAQILEEKPLEANGGVAPSLYQRRFKLTNLKIIHGKAEPLAKVSALTFSGFTVLSPNQRAADTRNPTLRLEGQAFFDSTLPTDSMDVLVMIGGPEIESIMGFMGNSATIESDPYKGQAVRAFLVAGADATLPAALPALVGWQPKPTLETAKTAILAPHPLIALDALRIAARAGTSDQIEVLAQWLLHPAQPAGVKAAAVELLGQAIGALPQGAKEVDQLLDVAVAGWEAERAYPIDATYLRAFQAAAEQIKQSNQVERVKAVAGDNQIRELSTLAKQLTNSLKK